MKVLLLFLIACIVLFSVAVATSPCGDKCGPAGGCCNDDTLGPVCFDPNTHTCTFIQGQNSGDNRQKLCAKGNGACTLFPLFGSPTACYNPLTHDCVHPRGGLVSFRAALCGKGQAFCGFSIGCFDPTKYKCCSQLSLCQIGQPGCDCTEIL